MLSPLQKTMLIAVLLLNTTASFTFAAKPKSKVTRQGEIRVRQLVTPPSLFNSLPLERRIFAYHLSQAMDAGRDIFWLQASPEGLAIRRLLEAIWQHNSFYSSRDRAALEEYLVKLYQQNSNYDEHSEEKFTLKGLNESKLINMASIAERHFKKKVEEVNLQDEVKRLSRELFDKNYRRRYEPPRIGQSLAQFYQNINSRSELRRAQEKYVKQFSPSEGSNPFLITYPRKNADGEIVFDTASKTGRFAEQLAVVDHYLGQAYSYANDQEKAIIAAHRKAITTGDFRDALEADRLWVQYKPVDIEFMLGFVEVYMDPMRIRGYWEGFLLLRKIDPATQARVTAIRKNAASYFEPRMPVNNAYKKTGEVTPPDAEAAYLMYTGGALSGMPFLGVNLPNDDVLSAKYGTKSFSIYNMSTNLNGDVAEKPEMDKTLLFYAPEYHDIVKKANHQLVDEMSTEFHEVLGHGSGELAPEVEGYDLGSYYSTVEEGRAELAAVYHGLDPQLRELGIVPAMSDKEYLDLQMYHVLSFFTDHVRSYVKLEDSTTQIRQAHQRARQAMLNWAIEKGALAVKEMTQGVPHLFVASLEKVRSVMGEMWAEIQDLKSAGESKEAKQTRARQFMARWDYYNDQHRTWRKTLLRVYAENDISNKKPITLNPKFKVETATDGKITDVRLSYLTGKRGISEVIHHQTALSKMIQKRCTALVSKTNN